MRLFVNQHVKKGKNRFFTRKEGQQMIENQRK